MTENNYDKYYKDGEGEAGNAPPPVPNEYKKETPFQREGAYVSPASYVQANNQNSSSAYGENGFYNPYTNRWEDRPLNPYTLPEEDKVSYSYYQPDQQQAYQYESYRQAQQNYPQAGVEQFLGKYKVVWTYVILIAVTIAFGIQMIIQGGLGSGLSLGGGFSVSNLLELGGLNQQLVRDGEWWRLITVMFLHGSLLHILLNGLALYSIGMVMERLMGGTRFLAIYFLGGLGGALLSFGLGNYPVAVGASGAIFALLGGLTAFFWRHRNVFGSVGRSYLNNLLFNIVINAVITFSIPNIDAYAHFGGLAFGLVLGYFLPSDYTKRPLTTENLDKTVSNWLKNWWVIPVVLVAEIVLFALFLSMPFTPAYPLRVF
jgi:rhomboid protease GluP